MSSEDGVGEKVPSVLSSLKELWLLVFCKSFPSDAFTPDQSEPSALLRHDKNPEYGGLFFFLQHLKSHAHGVDRNCAL